MPLTYVQFRDWVVYKPFDDRSLEGVAHGGLALLYRRIGS